MGDEEKTGNGKNGKKGVNWSGIAALVTALGGVLGMFVIQDKKGNESEMMQQSTFVVLNARMETMEKRLMRIENMMLSGRAAVMLDKVPECNTGEDCENGYICIDSHCEFDSDTPTTQPFDKPEPAPLPPPKPTVRRGSVKLDDFKDYKDIKDYVQAEQKPVRFKD